jgi:hypothetical protein
MGTTRACNSHRWYLAGTSQYASSDPEGLFLFFTSMPRRAALRASLDALASHPVQLGQLNLLYGYADQGPVTFEDPLGAPFPNVGPLAALVRVEGALGSGTEHLRLRVR